MSVEIVGPFPDRRLVINGWTVPMMAATELDGGTMSLVLDGRIGMTIDAENFETVACFIADVVGACFGYGAHPRDDIPIEQRREWFARVPHPSLAPSQVKMIELLDTEANGGEG